LHSGCAAEAALHRSIALQRSKQYNVISDTSTNKQTNNETMKQRNKEARQTQADTS